MSKPENPKNLQTRKRTSIPKRPSISPAKKNKLSRHHDFLFRQFPPFVFCVRHWAGCVARVAIWGWPKTILIDVYPRPFFFFRSGLCFQYTCTFWLGGLDIGLPRPTPCRNYTLIPAGCALSEIAGGMGTTDTGFRDFRRAERLLVPRSPPGPHPWPRRYPLFWTHSPYLQRYPT